jgi:drug/metabolite transporter (DMT)-like permease
VRIIWEPWPATVNRSVWTAWLITAIPATSLAFLIQTTNAEIHQRHPDCLVLSMEPVFAAIFAYYLAEEILTIRSMIGCG